MRVADIEAYARDVLERVPLERLLRSAETMLRSPMTVTIWVLVGMLVFLTPVQAAIASPIVFLAWSVLGPGFVTLTGIRIFRWLESVPLQGITFIVVLSRFGNSGQYGAVLVGVAGFIVLRWGLAAVLFEPVAGWFRRPLYHLPVADQILRAVIIRHALAERVSLPQLDAMERRMMDIASRRGASRRPESDT